MASISHLGSLLTLLQLHAQDISSAFIFVSTTCTSTLSKTTNLCTTKQVLQYANINESALFWGENKQM